MYWSNRWGSTLALWWAVENFDFFFFFLKLGFTPCKAEQPLQGMELQEKKDFRSQSLGTYGKMVKW